MKRFSVLLGIIMIASILFSFGAAAQCPCSRCKLGNCIPSYFGYCTCEPAGGLTCHVDIECGIGRPAGGGRNLRSASEIGGSSPSISWADGVRAGISIRAARRDCVGDPTMPTPALQYKVVAVEVY